MGRKEHATARAAAKVAALAAALCVAGCTWATALDDIPGDTEIYSAAQTDAAIAAATGAIRVAEADFTPSNAVLVATIEKVAPAPGNYLAVSNASMNARAKTDLNVYTNGLDGTYATGDRLATTSYTDHVGGRVARDATNYTDAVAAEFENGTREVDYASDANMAFYLAGDDDTYNAADLFRESTNAAVSVADAKISTNNAAFVSAVLAVPLTGADAGDLAEIAEYGGYGTVGAALLALIAGLAALKRRITAAETALALKADADALPYALVEPGEWEFSGYSEGVVIDSISYDSGLWTLSVSYNGDDYYLDAEGSDDETELTFLGIYTEPYDRITATRPSLPGHLLDRAVNAVPVTGATTLTLPALVNAGKARDFLVRLEISGSTVPTITFAAPTGETITYETDGDEFPVPDEIGTWLYSFTETAAHKFAVSLKKVNVVAQGGS